MRLSSTPYAFRAITVLVYSLLFAGCSGSQPDNVVLSPTVAEDPARAEQARLEDEAIARRNREAEAKFMRRATPLERH